MDWTEVKWTPEETARFLAKMSEPYRFHHEKAERELQEQRIETVSYFFKPKTKYPPRIYLLYGAWPVRNRRAAGISTQPCLYVRKVTQAESDRMEAPGRMMSRQYEAKDMDRLIFRHMEDGLTDAEIQQMLDAVLPICTPEFRRHSPVSEIRKKFNQ